MANLPLVERLPYREPLEILSLLPGQDKALLHSALVGEDIGRYSFVVSDPFLVLSAKGRAVEIKGIFNTKKTADPITVLRELLQQYLRPHAAPVPFSGGVLGYFAYDLGFLFEDIPDMAADDLMLPDLYLPFYDRVVAVDHIKKETILLSHGYPKTGREGEIHAAARMRELAAVLSKPGPAVKEAHLGPAAGELRSNFTRQKYLAMVEQGKEYIKAGDIFQVNLSQRFQVPLNISPWELYLRLTRINAAPFAAYLDFQPAAVVSASPERFISLTGNAVETRPIKGTRPRGSTEKEDQLLRRELYHSEKDRAELVMIVDLERNDLGRVCRTGSVRVPEVFRLEQYATVFHLVSTVQGELLPGTDITHVIRAAFPGGSITGAPKIRAMEIIEELEPTKRNIYTGSVGWIDFCGDADLNIVIRTFIVKDGTAYFQVGGGITADSEAEAEYQETLDKAKALIECLGKGL